MRRYRLQRRTWESRTDRTPPYAGCYHIPQDCLEGEVGGHVVTFRGKFDDRFTGEVLVGAFDAWWNWTLGWQGGTVHRIVAKGSWEGRLEPVRELAALLETDPAFERIGISFSGLSLQFKNAPADLMARVLDLAAETVPRLLARFDPPLLLAAKAEDAPGAAALLDNGADPDEYGPRLRCYSPGEPAGRYEYRDTPLLAAVMNDDPAMVALLLSRGADVLSNLSFIAWVALENRRYAALRSLFAGGMPLPSGELPFVDDYPLPFAASKGDIESVRVLLEAGADPDQKRPGFLNDAAAKADGPHKEEIRRLIREARERAERKEGQLTMASAADGAELSKPRPE